jgi:uncharacterized protein (TIGR03083 family)
MGRLPSHPVNAPVNGPVNAAATPAPEHDTGWYLAHLMADASRFAEIVRDGPLDAPVVGCPGWDLRALTAHQGVIHRWARHCAVNGSPPESRDAYEPDPALDGPELARWLTDGAVALVEVLGAIEPDGPTWHPFPVPKVGRVWPRRQAQEISIHRWDAERSVGPTTPIDPALASDGVDEYLDLVMRRLVARDGTTLPSGSLHLHCTDTYGEWLVAADGEGYKIVRAHEKGAAALRGPAEALVLRLWNRDSDRAGELSPVGDSDVLEQWLSLGSR